MNPAVEEAIEAYIDGEVEVDMAINEAVGKVIPWHDGLNEYTDWLKSLIDTDFTGMKIALDLANGSATSCAAEVLRDLGADIAVIHKDPNGVNINTACGSTHPQELQDIVRQGDCVAGFAFDGDADRLIAVAEDGTLITGDHTMYICGCDMHERKQLKDDIVVTTVMSNLGLYRAFDEKGIAYEQTQVGDKYVFECMNANNYSLGGEQSGHIIFKAHANTGDGLLTALKLLEVMKHTGKTLKELSEPLFIYPQLLINVEVNDKHKALEDSGLLAEIQNVETTLGKDGRILVRPSGTEPLVRVMVEARTDELCEQYVNQVVNYIKSKGL